MNQPHNASQIKYIASLEQNVQSSRILLFNVSTVSTVLWNLNNFEAGVTFFYIICIDTHLWMFMVMKTSYSGIIPSRWQWAWSMYEPVFLEIYTCWHCQTGLNDIKLRIKQSGRHFITHILYPSERSRLLQFRRAFRFFHFLKDIISMLISHSSLRNLCVAKAALRQRARRCHLMTNRAAILTLSGLVSQHSIIRLCRQWNCTSSRLPSTGRMPLDSFLEIWSWWWPSTGRRPDRSSYRTMP